MKRYSDPLTCEKCIHIVATMTNEIERDHCIQNCPVSTNAAVAAAAEQNETELPNVTSIKLRMHFCMRQLLPISRIRCQL